VAQLNSAPVDPSKIMARYAVLHPIMAKSRMTMQALGEPLVIGIGYHELKETKPYDDDR
jgi:hypothetical protein